MNNRIWILATALVSIIVIAFGLVVGVLPKLAESSAANLSLTAAQQQIAANEAALADLKSQFADIDKVREELAELRKTMPADGAYSEFIREVNAIAAETGSTITGYSQTAPLVFGPTAADGGTEKAPISGGSLIAIPVELRFSAPGLGGLSFMDKLRLGERILYINGFNFTFNADVHGNVFGDFIVNVYIYTLADPSDATDPATPPSSPGPTDPTPNPTDSPSPSSTDAPTPEPTESSTPPV
jgi:hypothetical protein